MDTQTASLFLAALLAGTGVFLVGVRLLTDNIEQLATAKIRDLFNKTADKKLVNVGIGAITTAIIQSSGVTTVLIVGFVNVGIMNLHQATAMIMGANIGTTITAQIAALSAFPFTSYIEILAFVGIMMAMVCSNERTQKVGLILSGLGLVFIGLSLMSDSMAASRDAIQGIFEAVTNPMLLFFIGILLTALVQSSSATTSVIIAMSIAGLTIGSGGNEVLYIILGTNIGSCVTALMSSMGESANARRASLIHLMFNTFGSAIFFVVFMFWPTFMHDTFKQWFPEASTQIAMFHTFFNTICTVLFLPFSDVFVRIARALIPDKQEKAKTTYLDERMISSPMLAIGQIYKETMLLADSAMDSVRIGYRSFIQADTSLIPQAQRAIEATAAESQEITNYLIRVSANCTSADEESCVSNIHNNIGDIVRISEISDNLTKYTRKEVDRNLNFSPAVKEQLDVMMDKLESLYSVTRAIVLTRNQSLLPDAATFEDEIDDLRRQLIDNHIERLNAGECKPENSSVFINLVSNLERIGDHLFYIASTVKSNLPA